VKEATGARSNYPYIPARCLPECLALGCVPLPCTPLLCSACCTYPCRLRSHDYNDDRYGSGRVVRFLNNTIDMVVQLPVANPTSCTFGGPVRHWHCCAVLLRTIVLPTSQSLRQASLCRPYVPRVWTHGRADCIASALHVLCVHMRVCVRLSISLACVCSELGHPFHHHR
jgi:hypothetical protein